MSPVGARMPLSDVSQTQLIIILVAGLLIVGIIAGRILLRARHDNSLSGYRLGRDVYVRCREGHVFTTTWIPLVSFKAVRLGPVRLQYCPVGRHVSFVTLVRDTDLTDIERRMAEHYHDGGLP